MTGRPWSREAAEAWDSATDHGADVPRAVRESLSEVTRSLQLDDPVITGAVFTRWTELVGEGVAGHVRPRTLRRGVLTVEVDDPAWATQLRYLEGDLVRRLTAELGAGAVRGLRLVVRRG